MKRSMRYLLTVGLLALLTGCGQDGITNGASNTCVSGATLACACPDGSASARVCEAGVFGACVCGDTSGGSDTVSDTAPDTAQPGDVQDDTALVDVAPDASLADTTNDAATDVVAGTDTSGPETSGPVACVSDKDCTAAGQVCDPLTKICVPCLIDADCPASQHCVATACVGFTGCSNSLGCVAAKGPDGKDQPICDAATGECTACLTAADCPASNDCLAKACVPFKVCQNSTQCGQDEVCDATSNRCVQCASNADCPENTLCEAGKCNAFTPCVSDKACTKLGQLCDVPKGKCAQCLKNVDCPEIYHCETKAVAGTGMCVLDVCAQGQGACNNNQKVTCNLVGDGFGAPEPCGLSTTCTAPGGKPECKPWICTPGVTCDGDKVVTCTDDGFTVLTSLDCAASDGKCVAGSCQPIICLAGEAYCDGQTVKQCSADGLSASVTATCALTDFCDAGACKPQVCAPDQPVCVADVLKTCNTVGSGVTLAAGTDCAATGQKCLAGECKTLLCSPATLFCDGNNLKTCSADGLSMVKSVSCGVGKFCGVGPTGDAACLVNVCAPDQPVCDGTIATVCTVDGSGYVAGGQDCALTADVCVAGTCKPQICQAATPFCDGSLLKTCSPDGTSVTKTQPCGTGYFCGLNKTADAACMPIVCDPGQPACNGKTATNCKPDGSGYVTSSVDCSLAGKVCSAGACVSLLCDPQNPLYCNGMDSMKCDASGLSPVKLQTCASNYYCAAGACSKQICSPNSQAQCAANKPAVCNADGSGYVNIGADCGAGKTCQAGVCLPQLCAPGTNYCDGSSVKQCDATGLSPTTLANCGSGTYCSAASCLKQACSPGSTTCTGTTVKTCNAEGSGYLAGGQDCAATANVCVTGACKPLVCQPAVPFCDGSSLKTCSADGTSVTKTVACGAGYFCGLNKTADAACQPVVCSPGQPACDGKTATTCNTDGSGFATSGVDCASNGKVCSAGACVTLLCDPLNPLYCNGLDAMKCDATGLNPVKQQTCATGYFCAAGACSKQICTPNSPAQCAANKPATCNADGSGYLTVGADCGVGKTCQAGVCLPQICTPNTKYCDGAAIKQCDATGLSPTTLSTCGAGTYCAAASCANQVCSPNSNSCSGALVTTCNADGSGYLVGTTDCAALGLNCVSGTCKSQICSPGVVSCAGLLLQVCKADGLSYLTTNCDDSDFCTVDTCDSVANACGHVAKTCDDGNDCTADVCASAACSHGALSGTACSDGNPCTNGESCAIGVCKGSLATVTTIAGSVGAATASFVNGAAAVARFNKPTGAAIDEAGALFVADSGNNQIRTVAVDGTVTTAAGAMTAGYVDGAAAVARFSTPSDVSMDPGGAIVIADTANNRIRRLSAAKVTTVAGSGAAGFLDGPASSAQFKTPNSVDASCSGVIYVSDSGNHRIRAIAADGTVSTLAGNGAAGGHDGPAAAATFLTPSCVRATPNGMVWVVDSAANTVRRIWQGQVTAVAGAYSVAGLVDGDGRTARFNHPTGCSLDQTGNLYVVDSWNYRIRKITPDGVVSTVLGIGAATNSGATQASIDGSAFTAAFALPLGLDVGRHGEYWIADSHTVRKYLPAALDCNDGRPCTTDVCDSATGNCQNITLKDGSTCSDGNACSTGDTCAAGVCAGQTVACDDGDPCTLDACNASGVCLFSPNSQYQCCTPSTTVANFDDGTLGTVSAGTNLPANTVAVAASPVYAGGYSLAFSMSAVGVAWAALELGPLPPGATSITFHLYYTSSTPGTVWGANTDTFTVTNNGTAVTSLTSATKEGAWITVATSNPSGSPVKLLFTLARTVAATTALTWKVNVDSIEVMSQCP